MTKTKYLATSVVKHRHSRNKRIMQK